MTKDTSGCLVAILAWLGIFWIIGIPILKGIAKRTHNKDKFKYELEEALFASELAWLKLQMEEA